MTTATVNETKTSAIKVLGQATAALFNLLILAALIFLASTPLAFYLLGVYAPTAVAVINTLSNITCITALSTGFVLVTKSLVKGFFRK